MINNPYFPVIFVLVLVGCQQKTKVESPAFKDANSNPEISAPWFEDVTSQSGIDFVHDPGPVNTYFSPQSMGSGCAFFDCDGDGLQDIYLLQNAGPDSRSVNRLYRQIRPGFFEDITSSSGLGIAGFNLGVAIGDINNDGRPDVLLTQYGGVKLFLNRGEGRFEEVSHQVGVKNPLYGASAAFFDYDQDGWLDIVIVNYVDYDPRVECISPTGVKDFCGPNKSPPLPSKLFHNRGLSGIKSPSGIALVGFQDVSAESGIGRLPGPGLGVICADFNGDGWPDIFVANDEDRNRLWINQKNGKFIEEAVSRNVALTGMGKAYAGMGIALGDTNNKGRFDLFVTHLGTETNTLWRQEKVGYFKDRTQEANLFATQWHGTGFGTLMADFENKGSLDIAIANGRVYRGGEASNTNLGFWETYADRNQLFSNNGQGRFKDVSQSNPAFCNYWTVARGLACADYDNDGGLDLLVTAIGEKARLFRNVAPNRGHWLKLRVIDPGLKRDAYGAEIRLRSKGREQLRLLNPSESYLSSSSCLVHFGLGDSKNYESIEIRWPDGSVEQYPGGAADRVVEIQKQNARNP